VFTYDTVTMSPKNFRAEKVYSRTVGLVWTKHVNAAVTGYVILRDDEEIGRVTGTSYTDTGLETGAHYAYAVYGVTADGRESRRAYADVTTAAPSITDIATGAAQNRIAASNNAIYISVLNTKNHLPLGALSTRGYLYYYTGSEDGGGTRVLIGEAELNPATLSAGHAVYIARWDVEGIPDGAYSVEFVITDVDGVSAAKEGIVIVDHSVPETIVGVQALGDIDGITLSWSIAAELATTRYKLYRRSELDEAFRLIATINNRGTLSFKDVAVNPDRLYYYYVVGVNSFGLEGLPSEIAAGRKGTDTEGPIVTKLSPANNGYLAGRAAIVATAQDNVAVARVVFAYSLDNETWEEFHTAAREPFQAALDTTLLPDGPVRVRAVARDARGNESAPLTYVYMADNTGPEQVTGLQYSATATSVTLYWNDVADNDIAFYRVERRSEDGGYTRVTDVWTIGANLVNLRPGESQTLRVVGYDRLNNRGAPSADLETVTTADTTAPVIAQILPKPGDYAQSIPLVITADDDHAVRRVEVQVSADRAAWTQVHSVDYADSQKTRQVHYTLDVSGRPEGMIFVRAVAEDAQGNVGDSGETAPFVQYRVDRTAPGAPAGVKAENGNGHLEISWQQGAETDLGTYTVSRAESADGAYTVVASEVWSLGYIDRAVSEETTYYYKVRVNDQAGNESAWSEAVWAQVARDDEAPEVRSVYPASGSAVGPQYRTVSAYVTDNRRLGTIAFSYAVGASEEYSQIQEYSALHTYATSAAAAIPLEGLENGNLVKVRVTATDAAGNRSVPAEAVYTVDLVAPAVTEAAAVYEEGYVTVSWRSDLAEDLAGYLVYRKVGAGAYQLVSQHAPVDGQAAYSFTDRGITGDRLTYVYRVDAVDRTGNVSSAETPAVETPDRTAPTAVISCESVMEVGVEYEIDASGSTDNTGIVTYAFDLGDGTTSGNRRVVHKYSETGYYTIALTVTDEEGHATTVEKVVLVKTRGSLGAARIRVVDENGRAVSGASVYFDLGSPEQVVRRTDINGYAVFAAEVGRHTVGSVIPDNEWLPAKKDILVAAGETTEVTMTLVHHTMIEGRFEITRMTFEEIVAAGIDISDPENQYWVTVHVILVYQEVRIDRGFIYNPVTGAGNFTPIYIGDRSYNVSVIGKGAGGAGGSGLGGGGGGGDDLAIAILDIPVTVSTLKEFFNVNLHIINNAASEFKMLDNRIELNLPNGLAIMDTQVSEKDAVVNVPEIAGQTTKTITWILRGDEVGSYYLTADYQGLLAEFNEPIYTRFVADEPIRVYGLEGLTLTVDVANELHYGTMYYNATLTNNSDRDVYLPNIDTEDLLLAFEHFDAAGRAVCDADDHGQNFINLGVSQRLEAPPIVLRPGERIRKHFYHAGAEGAEYERMRLIDYFYKEVENTYGLGIQIVPRSTGYFLSYLNINPPEPPEVTLTSIEITAGPAKTTYEIGETLDITGLVVTGHYSDGSAKAEAVTAADVSGFSSAQAAESLTLTVTVGGQTATFTVTVRAAQEPPPVTLTAIEITAGPAKTTYEIGGTLDITGLVVTGHYSDGSAKIEAVTAADVSGFNSAQAAESLTLTVTVGGQTATFTVTVRAAPEPPPEGTFVLTADKAGKTVTVSGSGYAPGQALTLKAAYNREPSDGDYTAQVTADAEGRVHVVLPATVTETAPWLGGESWYVSLAGEVQSAPIYATYAKAHSSARISLRIKAKAALNVQVDAIPEAYEVLSSNPAVVKVTRTVSGAWTVTGVKAGTAMITVRTTDGSNLTHLVVVSVA
jgi:PKD repeat protein